MLAARKSQVIKLRLMHAREMFELPQTDLFSEYRNFLTGVDFCLSELRGRQSFRPVRLEISLPPQEIDHGMAERLARTLRRYCEHRVHYNRRESRAQRFGGISALRIGVPLCVLGLALTVGSDVIRPPDGIPHTIADQLGWVLVWIGLWFPLDQIVFYPLFYGRESRVLRQLAGAEIVLTPHEPGSGNHAVTAAAAAAIFDRGPAQSADARRNRQRGTDVLSSYSIIDVKDGLWHGALRAELNYIRSGH
ncbi:MAG TPA: hypothetical protein VMR00_18095 [Streptosporangiaceae bacterium]|jgi:hypothetical protein|nr:hypothetical protein [Streptosporangiaceae bacterium]